MPKILVVGAGVAGLTVAHECVERGCEVLVLEKAEMVGGKAATDLYQGMPRDHAPKNISPYYYCLLEQLKRIPTLDGKTVYEEVSPMLDIVFCYEDKSATFSSSLKLSQKIRRMYRIWRFCRQFIPRKELLFFGSQLIKYLFSTPRRRKELDQIRYLDLLQLDKEHPLVKLIEAISAVDVNGSALMCLDQFYRQVLGIFNPHKLQYTTNYFSKPASDSFFVPWKSYLEKLGVTFVLNEEVLKLEHNQNVITKIITKNEEYDDFDECVIASDIPGLKELNRNSSLNLAAFSGAEYCERKAGGFFIAMTALPSFHKARTFTVFLDHPWSMVTISFTTDNFTNPAYFPGHCKAYVWVALVSVDKKGKYIHKTLEEATAGEVLLELTHSLRFSEEDRQHVITGYWGHSVHHEQNGPSLNQMTTVFTRSVNPRLIANTTQYDNLFLAGEFTDTLQKSPTMEKANESAKRCSEIILRKYNVDYPKEKFQYKYLPFQAREERM